MSICINPNCPKPQNTETVLFCQGCGSELLLAGRYRVTRQLGGGGFGKTFEVSDKDGIPKVLKVLINNHPKSVELFQREAQVLSQLNHPGIPKVEPDTYFTFSPRNSSEPLHCLVMEKIEGLDLSEYIQQRGSPIDQKVAIEWLTQLATILRKVHSQNFFHRDIKPQNIMLRTDGHLVLIDFGTARAVTGTYMAKQALGQVTGIISEGYTPPEQLNGQAVQQSDFFALGRTFVYLLTASDPSAFYDPRTDELRWRDAAPDVSPLFADFLDQMMARLPHQRPDSTEVILQRLVEIDHPLHQSQAGFTPTQSVTISGVPSRQQASTFPSKVQPSRSSQVASSQQQTISIAPVNLQGQQAGSHSSHPSGSTSRRKLPILIATGAGIATTLALTFGIYWWKLLPDTLSVKTLAQHSDSVWSVAISPDGQTLASGSQDKTIKLWNLRTREVQRTLSGHSDWILAVAFSADNQTLASAGYAADKTVKLWNPGTGQPLRTLSDHSNEVWSVAISPNGQTLASGSNDQTIKLWNLRTGELLRTLVGHTSDVLSVAISPDGQTLASASSDKTIKLWNLPTGELLHTLSGHSETVRAVAISPDGQTLASSSRDKTIKLWNLKTRELRRTLSEHSGYVNSVAISPDGKLLASGSDDKTIKIWTLPTGELRRTFSGHSNHVNSVAFSPDGQTVVSGSEDRTIKIWQAN
jgi:WD40 repeat protein